MGSFSILSIVGKPYELSFLEAISNSSYLKIEALLSYGDSDFTRKLSGASVYSFFGGNCSIFEGDHSNENKAELYDFLSPYQQIFSDQIERLIYQPISSEKKKILFHRIVDEIFRVYKKHDFSAVIYFHTPHIGFDFISMLIAKFLNIPCIIFNPTNLSKLSRVTSYIDLNNEGLNYEYDLCFENALDSEFSESYNEVRNRIDISFRKKNLFAIVKTELSFFRFQVSLFTRFQIYIRQTIFWYNKPKLGLELIHWYRKRLAELNRTIKFYENNSVKSIGSSEEYVLFASHYQPERTTNPEGGSFYDAIKALLYLRSFVPENITIYFKEHPEQFNRKNLRSIRLRSAEYYQRLLAIPNVKLLSISLESEKIIEGALCVSTITGTVGVESLRNGVPVITFGDAYYNSCKSVLHVSKFSTTTFIDLIGCHSRENVLKNFNEYLDNVKNRFIPLSFFESYYKTRKLTNKDKAIFIDTLLKILRKSDG